MQYELQGPIKGQVYAHFVAKLSSEGTQPDGNDSSGSFQWMDLLTNKGAVLGSF